MKSVLTGTVTFVPASKTLDFSAISGFDLKKLYSVVNETKKTFIYAPALGVGYGYSAFGANILTLDFDTTAHSAGDVLQIVYDSDVVTSSLPSGAATSANQAAEIASLSSIDSKLATKALNNQVVATDVGLIANAVIHGLTTGGGGGYVDVKVNPSGALTVDATVSSSALPTGAATSANQSTEIASLASIDTKSSETHGTLGLPIPTKAQLIAGVNASGNLQQPTVDTLGSMSSKVINNYGITANISTDGELSVSGPGTAVFNDTFDGAVIDTVNWATPVLAGTGAVTQASSSLVINVGTSAANGAQISTNPYFKPEGLNKMLYASAVKLEASVITGSHRFWGLATQGTTYSVTNPIKDGYGFEVTTAGVLQAVIYASDVLIWSQVLTIPTDGLFHAYVAVFRQNITYFYMDTFDFPVAYSTPFMSPDVSYLPIRLASLVGASPLGGAQTFQVKGVGINDDGDNHTDIADGTYKFRKAGVSSVGNLKTEHPDVFITGQAAQTATINNIIPATAVSTGTDVSNYKSAAIQIVSTGTGGTFIFEASNDGTNWVTQNCYNQALTTGVVTSAAVTATASSIIYTFPISARYIRVRIATTITGGSIQAVSRFSQSAWSHLWANNVITSGTLTTVTTVTTCASVTSANLAINGIIADQASAAITTTTTSSSITPTFGLSYKVSVPVTVVSGTNPTMDLAIEESSDTGTNWFKVYDFPRITATGFYQSPTITSRGNRVRYVATIGGTTPSFTRAVFRLQASEQGGKISQIIDRSITLTSLNSTTPSLFVEGSNSVNLEFNVGAITTTAPQIQIEGSSDGATFYSIGSPLTAVASSSVVSVQINSHSAKFIRGRISTAGVGVTAGYVLIKAY